MIGRRLTAREIVEILKAKEAGAKTAELCRQHGIDEATFYRWKARYGGMTLLDGERLRALKDEEQRSRKVPWPRRYWTMRPPK